MTRGNPTEVKVVLASVVAALTLLQVALIAVCYGKLRPRFLGGRTASLAHRAIGDTLVAIIIVVAVLCVVSFELDEAALHAVAASLLLGVLATKIAVVRWLPALHRLLPALGLSIWALIALTFATSAGPFLADR